MAFRKGLLVAAGAAALLALVLVVNALRASAPPVHARERVRLADVDPEAIAGHLGEAIRFETVSVQDDPDASADALLALHAWLERTYPVTHAALDREVVNGGSLLFTWPGGDPGLAPVAFLAHMDVVPADAATLDEWTHPPFAGVVADGYVWGRGALDMKSTLVTLMEAVEQLSAAKLQPARTVYLAFGHDEEVGGGRGAAAIAALLAERGVRLAWLIDEGGVVTENAIPGFDVPLAMIAVAEKGYVTLEIAASGEGGHSSTPPAVTSVGRLAEALVELQAHPFPASINPVTGEMIERIGRHAPFAARLVTANRWLFDPLILQVMTRDRVLASMTRTTTAPTMLEASPKENVLASVATARVNFRVIPGETTTSVRERVRAIVGDDGIDVRAAKPGSDPSPVSRTDTAGFVALERSIAGVFPEAVVVPGLLMGGTDSGHYREITVDIYRFAGLRIDRDDVARFHGIDERVPVAALGEMVQFYVDLMGSGLGGRVGEQGAE